MLISQNYDYDEATFVIEENDVDKAARLNRLRAAEIKRELKDIDTARIRPLAAIVSNSGTDEDTARLAELEAKAQALRAELATLTEVTS